MRHWKLWLGRTPTAFTVANFRVRVHWKGQIHDALSPLLVDDPEYRASFVKWAGFNWQRAMEVWEQKNKGAGVAWWLPRWSFGLRRRIHPNSRRLSFAFLGLLYGYDYTRGRWEEAPTELPYRALRPAFWLCRVLAYALLPFIGGDHPAPFTVYIDYDITYHFD